MKKTAVVGDTLSALAFRVVGFDTYPVERVEDAGSILRELADCDYAVIFVTEEIAAAHPSIISYYARRTLPAVTVIPGMRGNMGSGMSSLKNAVERAVGADIIFGGK